MSRYHYADTRSGEPVPHAATDRRFVELEMCATRSASPDRVSAHNWFSLAALHGNKYAAVLRIRPTRRQ